MSDRNIPTIDKKDLDSVRQLIENEIKQNKLAPLELTDIISDNNEIDDKYVDKAEDNLNHFITTTQLEIWNEFQHWRKGLSAGSPEDLTRTERCC